MTKEELVDRITDWESEAAESFNDYFTADSIDFGKWIDFLRKKGFSDIANENEEECRKSEYGWCVDQSLLFDLVGEYEGGKYNKEKNNENFLYLAEFILEDPKYLQETLDFLISEEY